MRTRNTRRGGKNRQHLYMEALEKRVLLSGTSNLALPDLTLPLSPAITVGLAQPTVILGIVQAGKPSQAPVFRVLTSGGAGTPTGTVTLFENGTQVGVLSYTLVGGVVQFQPVTPFSIGTHKVQVQYSGDGSYSPGASGFVTFTIAQRPTTTTLTTNLASIVTGTTVTLNASVASVGLAATGNVKFFDGNTLLGTVAIDASGNASLTPTLSGGGNHVLTAVYQGDTDNSGSTSNAVNEDVMAITTIRLLVLYASDVDPAGIVSDVAAMNQALLNSEIPAQVLLVHDEVAEVENPDGTTSPYVPTHNYNLDLTRLSNDHDGIMDNVFALRSEYQADLVSFMTDGVENDGNSVTFGLAYELTSRNGNPAEAFSVTIDPNAPIPSGFGLTQNDFIYAFAHELGHNLGANHDPINDPAPNTGSPAFIQGRGSRFVGDDGTLYHTIMAYAPGTVIPYYSNPNVSFMGVATGSATQDVAAVITQMAPIVANYHNLIPPTTTPHLPTGAFDAITTNATKLTGYGYDRNSGPNAVNVEVSIDGVMSAPFKAGLARTDLTTLLGSTNHGFSYTLPTTLTNGAHTVKLYVQDTPGTSYVLVDTETLNIDKRPDLTATVGAISPVYGTYVPGDWVTMPVTVKNGGIANAVGTVAAPIKVDVRMSTDNVYDNSDILVQQLSLPFTLVPGQSVTLLARFQIGLSTPPANYQVVVKADSTGIVNELDETNNTAVNATVMPVVWNFGQVVGRTGSVPITFADANGTMVTVRLAGPGIGTLTVNAGNYDLALTGTTSATSLTITTVKTTTPGDDGRFTLHDLTVAGSGGMGSITASTTDVTDAVAIGGSINTLTLGNVAGLIAIGPAASGTPSATVSVGTANGMVLASAIPLTSLTVKDWTGGGTLAGETVGRIVDLGTLSPDINLSGGAAATTLGPVTVTNQITGGTWTITGPVGPVTAKSVTGLSVTVNDNGGILGNLQSLVTTDATATNNLQLTANAVTTLSFPGNLQNSSITLRQGVSATVKALGSLFVGKSMTNSDVNSLGNMGSITVGALDHTLLFAGVNNSVTSLPLAASDFVAEDPLPTITLVNVTGLASDPTGPALIDSSIAAGTITTAKVVNRASAISDPDLTNKFGFATVTGAVTAYSGPVSVGNFVAGTDSQVF